jgi:hypothetical protein
MDLKTIFYKVVRRYWTHTVNTVKNAPPLPLLEVLCAFLTVFGHIFGWLFFQSLEGVEKFFQPLEKTITPNTSET